MLRSGKENPRARAGAKSSDCAGACIDTQPYGPSPFSCGLDDLALAPESCGVSLPFVWERESSHNGSHRETRNHSGKVRLGQKALRPFLAPAPVKSLLLGAKSPPSFSDGATSAPTSGVWSEPNDGGGAKFIMPSSPEEPHIRSRLRAS